VANEMGAVVALYFGVVIGSLLIFAIYSAGELLKQKSKDKKTGGAWSANFFESNESAIVGCCQSPLGYFIQISGWPIAVSGLAIVGLITFNGGLVLSIGQHLLIILLLSIGIVKLGKKVDEKKEILFLLNKKRKLKEYWEFRDQENRKDEQKRKREEIRLEAEKEIIHREQEKRIKSDREKKQKEQKKREEERLEFLEKASFWRALDGHAFEREVAFLLRKRGWKAWKTKGSNDGGIDINAEDTEGKRVIIQCKAHCKKASPGVVRELFGVFQSLKIPVGNGYAILITLEGASLAASRFASENDIYIWSVGDLVRMSKYV